MFANNPIERVNASIPKLIPTEIIMLTIMRDVLTLAVMAAKIKNDPKNMSSNNGGGGKKDRGTPIISENIIAAAIFDLVTSFISKIFQYTYKETIRSPKILTKKSNPYQPINLTSYTLS